MKNTITGILLCCLGTQTWSQTAPISPTPPVRDPADRIFREQQQREREQNLRLDPAVVSEPPRADMDTGFPQIQASGPVFVISSIVQQGDAGLLGAQEFARISAPFIGQTLGAEHIGVLLDRVTKTLVANGYITSRAYVGQQNLAQGELALTIVAGRIEKILYNGKTVGDGGEAPLGVRMALPMQAGDILRLQDMEQGVDQINRLRRNSVQAQIKPGEQSGGSIIELGNQPGDARNYNLGLDNQGSPGTGRMRVQMGAEQGNGLGLMEAISLGLTTSQETNAIFGTVSVPWGYNTVSMMGSWSEYQNLIGDTALVYGTSRNWSLALNRLLLRDQTSKTALDLSLARRRSDRAINNAQLAPQRHTVLRMGVNRLTRFPVGTGTGQWTLDAGLVRGLGGWGADRDAPSLPAEAARAQFTKAELSATLQMPLGKGGSFRSRFASQYSRTPLYSSEQIFAGGLGSVRGFAESAAGGDRGAYLRSEWVKEDLPLLWSESLQWQPYVFADLGSVQTVADARWRTLAGAGVGLRLAMRQGNLDIVVARPVSKPAGLPDAGTRINANLSLQF